MFTSYTTRASMLCAGIGLALLVTMLFAVPVRAETPEEKGLAIAQEAERRDLGWVSSATVLHMVLKNRHGDSSTRELRIQSL